MLNADDPVPSFTAKDQDGKTVTDKQLRGQPYVLYFYPKDDTPGCTKEACGFRDHIENFKSLNVRIIGISPDEPDDHQKFISKYNLNFTLLCDKDHSIAHKFNVWRSKASEPDKGPAIERSTFIVNSDGIVVWIERGVDVEGHIKRVHAALEELKRSAVL